MPKAFGEALGRLYADKFGLEVVCIRIGSFLAEPTEARHLSTWLMPSVTPSESLPTGDGAARWHVYSRRLRRLGVLDF